MKSEDSGNTEIKNIIRERWNEHCIKYKKRPEADIENLENLRFSVDVMDVPIPVFPRTKTFLGFIKYGFRSGRGSFLVRGIKQE